MNTLQKVSLRAALMLALAAGAAVPLPADITVASAPVGVMRKKLQTGTSGLAFPLIQKDVFVGVVEASAGSTLVFTSSTGDPAAVLDSGRPYYAEVVTGSHEGERLDVDGAATLAAGDGTLELSLGAGSHSTLPALADNALAGARIVVRPHVRLSDLPAMISPSLTGDNKHNRADGVNIYAGSAYEFYHLRANGAGWSKQGAAGEFGGLVIPPDASVQVVIRETARKWHHAGVVRTSAFRKNLAAGTQAFATGYPVALSPTELGAFVDLDAPAGTQWVGNADPEFADGIQLTALKPLAFNSYFLDADGATWRRVAGKEDVTDFPVAGATDAMLLRRANPDPAYLILPPFEP